MPSPAYAIALALFSLLVSATTLWLTLLRRGQLRMTLPTQVSFRWGKDGLPPQVFLLGLLHCTAKRGAVIENLFVRLRRGEATQNFSVWVVGSGGERLDRGGGLFVGQEGNSRVHYFFPPTDGTHFEFVAGQYHLELFASVVGRKNLIRLTGVDLHLSADHAKLGSDNHRVIVFDWGPDSRSYHARIHTERPPRPGPEVEYFIQQMRELVSATQKPSVEAPAPPPQKPPASVPAAQPHKPPPLSTPPPARKMFGKG